jgi:hypothetical protein
VFSKLLAAVLADPQRGVVAVNLEGRQLREAYAPMRAFAETTDQLATGVIG